MTVDLKPRDEGVAAEPAPVGSPSKAGLLQLAGAVFWAFFGVRKSSAQAEDVKNFKAVHVIIAGIVGALIFIAALILIVNLVIGSGVAAAN